MWSHLQAAWSRTHSPTTITAKGNRYGVSCLCQFRTISEGRSCDGTVSMEVKTSFTGLYINRFYTILYSNAYVFIYRWDTFASIPWTFHKCIYNTCIYFVALSFCQNWTLRLVPIFPVLLKKYLTLSKLTIESFSDWNLCYLHVKKPEQSGCL